MSAPYSDGAAMPEEDRTSSVERLIGRDLEGRGRPISRRSRHTQRTLEAYLRAGGRPRWMERISEIDGGIAMEKRRIARAYRALDAECGRDPAVFARRWHELVRTFRFDRLNELIRDHNEWYPIERDLPMDPRTRDYVLIHGRSYRRPVLGPDWVLEHFPPVPPGAGP